MSDVITYRELHRYKYQIRYDVKYLTGIQPDKTFSKQFIEMDEFGELTIKAGYAWDGASGGMPDNESNMRGSLIHDALYQAMRLGLLDYRRHRELADALFREICLDDGMAPWLANLAYDLLQKHGEKNAKPSSKDTNQWLTAP